MERLFSEGTRWSDPAVLLFTLPKEDPSEPAEVAFLVSRKLKRAVLRNRLRRRMREIYRRWVGVGDKPYYLAWVAREPATQLDFWSLREKMLRLYRKFSSQR
ncbi:ribonuclease P protein component [Candidatus Methylacidithermus pantelleriae]|uniref:Ribonuclease P protein component n=1 Tax=Candidatus Methylacidithermus pantelleriae TaxID=2744239 RepID=A0A8J2FWU3_9BACT|nr:putative Ribonuclease P protein component [Candidatus Methylacidithermus pantelleriae]